MDESLERMQSLNGGKWNYIQYRINYYCLIRPIHQFSGTTANKLGLVVFKEWIYRQKTNVDKYSYSINKTLILPVCMIAILTLSVSQIKHSWWHECPT